MPYIQGESGTDTWTQAIAAGLRQHQINVIIQPFHSRFQFFPRLLSQIPAPTNTNIVLANSWNGFAFRRPGTKLVVVEHLCVFDPVLESYKSFAQKLYHQQLVWRYINNSLEAADAIVAVSNYTADVMSYAYRIKKPRAILNGIDINYFAPSQATFSPDKKDSIRLLFVGNPSRRKGADLLEPIMKRLGSGYTLFYTAGLRSNKLAKTNLSSIHSLGRLNQNEVRTEYCKADLLVFPSRAEGLPLCVIESLACGTPVVAANVSSLPEVINSKVGRLCAVDDIEAFANAVRELTADYKAYQAMRSAARAHAEQVFSLQRMVDEYVSFFATL